MPTKSVFLNFSLVGAASRSCHPPPSPTQGTHVWRILFWCVMVFRIKLKAASSSKTLVFAKLHAIIFLKTIAMCSCENLKPYNRFLRCVEHFVLTLIPNCHAEYLNWSGRKSHDEEKSHTEELQNLYSFPSVFRLIKSRNTVWAGHVLFLLGQLKHAYSISVWDPDRKRPLDMCGYEGVDWMHLFQGRVHWQAVANLQVPWEVTNFVKCCVPIIVSQRTLLQGLSDIQKF